MQRLKAKGFTNQTVVWAHQKLDGHRLTVYKDSVGSCTALTTTDADISKSLKRWGWWLPIVDRLPCDTVLDGELWVPGKPASYIKTALKEGDPELRFSVFGSPLWNGIDITTYTLQFLKEVCHDYHIDFVPFEPYNASVDYLARARELGIEGWVMKVSCYAGWYKLKEVKTIDAFVIGFTEGRGKWLGLVGSLQVAVWYKPDPDGPWQRAHIGNAGGFDNATRIDIDEQADIMRVCEVAYQEIGSKGRLRHPRFKCWRNDKLAYDCRIDQDPQLESIWTRNLASQTST